MLKPTTPTACTVTGSDDCWAKVIMAGLNTSFVKPGFGKVTTETGSLGVSVIERFRSITVDKPEPSTASTRRLYVPVKAIACVVLKLYTPFGLLDKFSTSSTMPGPEIRAET